MKTTAAELLKALVRADTSDPPGNELAALDILADVLAGAGVAAAVQPTAPGRGNLLACVPATRPGGEAPLVLLSHVDVVPADPAQWDYPPFAARQVDGYIYGRGTVDTKQLTVMETAALCALAQKAVRTRDVYLLATADEECGSALGLQYFLAHPMELAGRTLDGAALLRGADVISEGGGFPVLAGGSTLYLCETGQKGCGTLTFTVKALEDRGPFLASGDAMVRATALAAELGRLEQEAEPLPAAAAFAAAMEEACGTPDWPAAVPPVLGSIWRAMTHGTVTPTLLRGKTASCVEVVCDVRMLPGVGREAVEALADEAARRWQCTYALQFTPGYASDGDGPVFEALRAATLAHVQADGPCQVVPFVSMGSSDGRFLAPLGARVYGYSPVYAWDMTFDTAVQMVHGVNERIHERSLELGCAVLADAVCALAAGGE